MLKKGQIKFSRKAASKAKEMLKRKNASKVFMVVNSKDKKPLNAKVFYNQILGVRQYHMAENKVFTSNINTAKMLLSDYIVGKGKLSIIVSPTYGCALYITEDQQTKYSKIKVSELDWPAVCLDESNPNTIKIFEEKINKKSVDLSEIILSLEK